MRNQFFLVGWICMFSLLAVTFLSFRLCHADELKNGILLAEEDALASKLEEVDPSEDTFLLEKLKQQEVDAENFSKETRSQDEMRSENFLLKNLRQEPIAGK